MSMKVALIIPDCHIPYNSDKAYDLMLQVACDLPRIDEITILGDYADFYCINDHGSKSPKVEQLLSKEIEGVNERLDELDFLFPKAEKVFIQGNHEYRLERFLLKYAPALFEHVTCPKLFELEKRKNWTWIPYGPEQLHSILKSKLFARHEPLGSSPKATATKALCSLVYGHIHRIEESHMVGIDGTDHVVFSCGWLGDKGNKEVFGYVKNQPQWQLGFSVAYVNPNNGYFYHHRIHILNNYTCFFNGKLYKA